MAVITTTGAMTTGTNDADSITGTGADETIRAGGGNDTVNGNSGDDKLYGEAGDDYVIGGGYESSAFLDGGPGHDRLEGAPLGFVFNGQQTYAIAYLTHESAIGGIRVDNGDDFLSGDRGSDTLTGGAGADRFYSFAAADYDRVTDFKRAEGDRVQIELGDAWTVAQEGADTVVRVSTGGVLVLAGVQKSSLTGDWIFTA